MGNLELTTMCAVFDGQKVLMINRTKSWKGWAFPGGHLEPGESVEACVKRELFEEAGIELQNLEFKGITNIYNTVNGKRHIIFNYTCKKFLGDVNVTCNEGKLAWVNLLDINRLAMAEGMEYRIPLFIENKVQELYIEWDEVRGYTKIDYC